MGRMTDRAIGPPPTIGWLRSQSVVAMSVHCDYAALGCGHVGRLAFDALGLPDSLVFGRLAEARRFVCSKCGRRSRTLALDWSAHVNHGVEGRVV